MLQGKKTRKIWKNINEGGVEVIEFNRVEKVEGKKVIIKAPVLVRVDKNELWNILKVNMLENCGFEDIHFRGNFQEEFIHHKNALHDSGFIGVKLNHCYNSWVRNTRFTDVCGPARIKSSVACTIVSSSVEGNSGHDGFGFATSTRCLMAYCEDKAEQWHGPNSSHASVGNVIFRFKGINSGIDLHANCPRFTLYDQCEIAGIDGERVGKASHGGAFVNLPNHLIGLVFWNYKQTALPRSNFSFWETLKDNPEQEYGPLTAVNPTIVGFQGLPSSSFDEKALGYMESMGQAVFPSSIILAQLEERGILIPAYMNKIGEKIAQEK